MVVLALGSARPVGAQPTACAPIPMDVAQAMLSTTNRERAAVGLGPVAMNAALNRAAHDHACAMGSAGFFAHQAPGFGTPIVRAQRAGYAGCRVLENIAMGQRNALQTFSGWMQRPGHRKNVLDAGAQEVGFGATAVVATRGGPRWVMLLGQRC